MKIKVGISNRHVHLCKEDFNKLFGKTEFFSIKDLSQEGEFVSNLRVDIKTEKDIIKNVRVVGPIRNHTQVEISMTDAIKLGINPPIKMSGDFDNAEDIMLSSDVTNQEVLAKKSCIIAHRHIHCKTSELDKYHLKEGQILKAKIPGIRGGILYNIMVKSKDNFNLELHIDTDEANAFNLKNGDYIDILEDNND